MCGSLEWSHFAIYILLSLRTSEQQHNITRLFAAAGLRERPSSSSASLCTRPQPQRVSICIRYAFDLGRNIQRRESGRCDQKQSRHSTQGKAGHSLRDMASGRSCCLPVALRSGLFVCPSIGRLLHVRRGSAVCTIQTCFSTVLYLVKVDSNIIHSNLTSNFRIAFIMPDSC